MNMHGALEIRRLVNRFNINANERTMGVRVCLPSSAGSGDPSGTRILKTVGRILESDGTRVLTREPLSI